ncbi:MAG: hypothetical protein F4Y86_10065 [Gammaproteobacteria bacterium]|nr:hypothetical protein [Gammaproteobacteria bacterium]
MPEVKGDRAAVDDGCLVAVAEAEFGRSGLPAGIVEVGLPPGGALITAVVQVPPRCAERDEFFGMGEGGRECHDGRGDQQGGPREPAWMSG